MADEIKEKQEDGSVKDETTDKRSEERYQDLIGKLKVSSEENETLRKQIRETEFSRDWDKFVAKYPKAQEHFEEIKSEFQKGKSVEDVAVVILHKNNKLMTAEQLNTEEKSANAGGGSADTKVQPPKNPQDVMRDPSSTHEDRVKILQELEAKGELGVKI